LLAIYHSHPFSEPAPSSSDVERNTYGETVLHAIISLVGGSPQVRVWRLLANGFEAASWNVL
jgi:proteasome lid subunit RPN8/RPN11